MKANGIGKRIKQVAVWLMATAGLVAIDQLVKLWTISTLKEKPAIVLWPGVFELTYVENRGAAFGILQNQQWLFTILTIAMIVGLAYVYFRLGPEKKFRLTKVCSIVVMAGAIGNLLDRVLRHFVVDTFYFKWIDFPVFNVADCYVVVFGILFCLTAFFQKELLEDIADELKGRKQGSGGTDF